MENLSGRLLATCQWNQLGMCQSYIMEAYRWSKGEAQVSSQSWDTQTHPKQKEIKNTEPKQSQVITCGCEAGM